MTVIAAVMAAIATPSVPTEMPDARLARWQPFIAEAASRYGLPATWLTHIMAAESGGETRVDGAPIRSSAGAIGLMQLMPATWAETRAEQHLGTDPDDPHDNILAAAAYLRHMVDLFGYPGAVAAYNAGPARYAAYLAHRTSLPEETLFYLAKVTGGPPPSPVRSNVRQVQSYLFALRYGAAGGESAIPDRPSDTGLFAIRRGLP